MTLSRRGIFRGCALAASGAAMGYPLRAWAQLEGSRIPTGGLHPVRSIQDTETPAQNGERMKWFREARFGMFIHWGLYAIPAGRWGGQPVPGIGEWIMNAATIPVADYKALAPKFNPTQFSAAQIVGLAQSAGMKYIVITSKHHDGFAMFDSKAESLQYRPGDAVQARSAEGVGGGVPQARHKTRLLLFAGPGLDGARRSSPPAYWINSQARSAQAADIPLGPGAGRQLSRISP